MRAKNRLVASCWEDELEWTPSFLSAKKDARNEMQKELSCKKCAVV
jgi:hypothetical protein